MTEEHKDNEPQNTATDAWSKNWLVPVLLLMLREWSSYGYELMEKLILSHLTADGKGGDGQFQLGYLRGGSCTARILNHRGRRSLPEVLGTVSGSISEDDEYLLPALHRPTSTEEERG